MEGTSPAGAGRIEATKARAAAKAAELEMAAEADSASPRQVHQRSDTHVPAALGPGDPLFLSTAGRLH